MSLLELHEVSKIFGGLVALNELSFSVEEGSVVGLIGPNGAGKTTVFNCITGNYRPEHGRITFAGRNVTGLRPHALVELGIARTFQSIRLFGRLPVLENVLAGRHCRLKAGLLASMLHTPAQRREEREAVRRCMQELEFVGLAAHHAEEAGSLSYGNQRLLEIARALASDPHLLILDEPSNGIDPRGFEAIRSLLIRLNREQGKTIFISSHQLEELSKLATSYGFMKNGRIVEQLSRAELEDKSKDYLLLRTADSRQAAVCLEELLHIHDYRILNRSDIQITEETDSAALIALLVKHDVPILECSWHHQSLEQYFFHKNGGERDVESV